MKRAFIAFLFFILDFNVRVTAVPLQEPHDCDKSEVCSVFVRDPHYSQINESYILWAAQGSSYRFNKTKPNQIEWIRGAAKVQAHRKTEFVTMYGTIEFSEGEVIIDGKDHLVTVTNISSDMKYLARGDQKWNTLPPGFSNYMTKVTSTGIAEVGFPKAAQIESLLKVWSKFYAKNESSRFKDDVKDFMPHWEYATRAVGPWYYEIYKRDLAAVQAEEARQKALKEKREAEDQIYRNMLRQRQLVK